MRKLYEYLKYEAEYDKWKHWGTDEMFGSLCKKKIFLMCVKYEKNGHEEIYQKLFLSGWPKNWLSQVTTRGLPLVKESDLMVSTKPGYVLLTFLLFPINSKGQSCVNDLLCRLLATAWILWELALDYRVSHTAEKQWNVVHLSWHLIDMHWWRWWVFGGGRG